MTMSRGTRETLRGAAIFLAIVVAVGAVSALLQLIYVGRVDSRVVWLGGGLAIALGILVVGVSYAIKKHRETERKPYR